VGDDVELGVAERQRRGVALDELDARRESPRFLQHRL
jgi:hypothetical protein